MLKLQAAAACVLATALWTAPARADEPPDWGDRTLAGHTFLFPATHAGAFITTTFGVLQGVYEEHFPSVPIPFGGSTNLDLIGYTATANLGIKITDWLGIQATGTALGVLGLDGTSILYAGGSTTAGGNVAPIVRIARIESTGTQISARGQIGWAGGEALNIPRLLVLGQSVIAQASNPADAATTIGQGLIQGGLTRTVVQGVDTFDVQGSIEAAQALGPMFGLQAAAIFERRVNGVTFRNPMSGDFRDSATRYDVLLDLSAEWDGASLGIPVAAIAEYQLNARLGGTGDELLEQESGAVHTFGFGVYYSGRPNLQVGLFAATLRNLRPIQGVAGAPGTSGAPSAQYAEMSLRYIW